MGNSLYVVMQGLRGIIKADYDLTYLRIVQGFYCSFIVIKSLNAIILTDK